MIRRKFSLYLFLLTMGIIVSFSLNQDLKASEFDVVDTLLTSENSDAVVTPYTINPFVPKSNLVSTSYSWGGYTRVSDNLRGPGSVSTNRTKTFGVTFSNGKVLGVSLNGSVSNALNYSFKVPSGKTAYIGYRVYYQNRTYNVCKLYDTILNKCNSPGWYKTVAKVPQYGEYSLIFTK